tara:strand:+ start:2983 stop:3276 length:294 start_codon:yes stop_codon:yes gene_type:complete
VIFVILLSSIVIAGVWPAGIIEVDVKEELWIPTEADIAYQDSMYMIIQSTQNDVSSIKQDIVYILDRLDYDDGSWDSIRYVEGGEVDQRLTNKRENR